MAEEFTPGLLAFLVAGYIILRQPLSDELNLIVGGFFVLFAIGTIVGLR